MALSEVESSSDRLGDVVVGDVEVGDVIMSGTAAFFG